MCSSVFALKAHIGQPVGAGFFAAAAVVRVGRIVRAQRVVAIVVLRSIGIVLIGLALIVALGCGGKARVLQQILQPRSHHHEALSTRLTQHGFGQGGRPGLQRDNAIQRGPLRQIVLTTGQHLLQRISSAKPKALVKGHRIEIRGFGSFSVNRRSPRIGRNPRSGESVMIPEKRVPHFKPGKALREEVDKKTAEILGRETQKRARYKAARYNRPTTKGMM